jgi:hypothetical protein
MLRICLKMLHFLTYEIYYISLKHPTVMRTGFSLCSISNREKPVFITGIPANENRFFPVWKYYTRKTLFWPCAGPVRDCSVYKYFSSNKKYFCFWLLTKMYQFITGFVGSSINIYEILMTIPALK